MKKTFVLLTLLCVALASFSQPATDTVFTKDYFLKKSRTQKTIAWGLLAGGTAMAVVGAIHSDIIDLGGDENEWGSGESGLDAADVLFIGGVVADLTSIVFFVNSAKNKRRAAAISFGGQKLSLPQPGRFTARTQPAVIVRVAL